MKKLIIIILSFTSFFVNAQVKGELEINNLKTNGNANIKNIIFDDSTALNSIKNINKWDWYLQPSRKYYTSLTNSYDTSSSIVFIGNSLFSFGEKLKPKVWENNNLSGWGFMRFGDNGTANSDFVTIVNANVTYIQDDIINIENWGISGDVTKITSTSTISYTHTDQSGNDDNTLYFDYVELFYRVFPTGGDFRWRIDGGSWRDVTTVSTIDSLGYTKSESLLVSFQANHLIEIEGVSGTSFMYGIRTESTVHKGYNLDFVNQGGSAVKNWSTLSMYLKQYINHINPEQIHILFGANDKGSYNSTPEEFIADYKILLDTIENNTPVYTDIVHYSVPEASIDISNLDVPDITRNDTFRLYFNKLKILANQRDQSTFDFGKMVPSREVGSALGYWNDVVHLNSDGNEYVTKQISNIIGNPVYNSRTSNAVGNYMDKRLLLNRNQGVELARYTGSGAIQGQDLRIYSESDTRLYFDWGGNTMVFRDYIGSPVPVLAGGYIASGLPSASTKGQYTRAYSDAVIGETPLYSLDGSNWYRLATNGIVNQKRILETDTLKAYDAIMLGDSSAIAMTTGDTILMTSEADKRYSSFSIGTDGQIPFMNSGGTDFDYSAVIAWDGTTFGVAGSMLSITTDGIGVKGTSVSSSGVSGQSTTSVGVFGRSIGSGTGVWADATTNRGLYATATSGTAVYARSTTGVAGIFFNDAGSTANILEAQLDGVNQFSVESDGDVNINGSIDLNSTDTPYKEGTIYYDEDTKALTMYNDLSDFSHQLGYEHAARYYNNTGSTINDGTLLTPVGQKINGEIVPTVQLAGNGSIDSLKLVAMSTTTTLNGEFGVVTLLGPVNDLDLSAYNDNDFIYVGHAGNIINASPTPPSYSLLIGKVFYADNDSGQLYMMPGNIDFTPSPHIGADTSRASFPVTINTQNVFEYIPIGAATVVDNFGFTIQGDSIQPMVSGYYTVVLSMSFQGNATSETWRYGMFLNNIEEVTKSRSTSSSDNGDVNIPISRFLDSTDWVSFRITNESGVGDPTVIDLGYEFIFLHE